MSALVRTYSSGRVLKLHAPNTNNAPRCGGGRGGKAIAAWQTDFGAVNCLRCLLLNNPKPKSTP